MPAEGTGEDWTPAGIAHAQLYAELARLQQIVDDVRVVAFAREQPEVDRIAQIKLIVR